MDSRIELQSLLEEILGERNVYFQPPESFKMKYPCIIYRFADESVRFADDEKYLRMNLYEVTVIDANPDTKIPKKVSDLKYCSFDRFFISDNLNHYVYRLYFKE